jgi:hypothetical protein
MCYTFYIKVERKSLLWQTQKRKSAKAAAKAVSFMITMNFTKAILAE